MPAWLGSVLLLGSGWLQLLLCLLGRRLVFLCVPMSDVPPIVLRSVRWTTGPDSEQLYFEASVLSDATEPAAVLYYVDGVPVRRSDFATLLAMTVPGS